MNTSTAEFDQEGHLNHSQGFIIDITDRVRMDLELNKAKEKAEAANQAKSDFLSSMTHELRTPLNAILGFSQLLSLGENGILNSRQKSYIRDIQVSSEHLQSIINDILELAKIEAGKVDIQKCPFDLGTTLRKLVQTMHPIAEKKGVWLSEKIDGDLGSLEADEVRGEGSQVVISAWDEGIGFGTLPLTGSGRPNPGAPPMDRFWWSKTTRSTRN